jgi:alpha-amylase
MWSLAVILILLASTVTAATPAQWAGRSIYQLLTDRFARTDGSTTYACDPSARVYCGGTWQGIISHLDYIQGMGFSAVWISPITLNLPETTPYGEAYHGYWQQNIDALNPNFGTAEDLKALSSALHTRGMYLMVDVVVNHFGWDGNAFECQLFSIRSIQ